MWGGEAGEICSWNFTMEPPIIPARERRERNFVIDDRSITLVMMFNSFDFLENEMSPTSIFQEKKTKSAVASERVTGVN